MPGFNFQTYIYRNSSVHRLDARSKIILLLIYSIALFFCDSWIGMLLYAGIFLGVLGLSKLPASKIFLLGIPIYVIILIAIIGNSFVFSAGQSAEELWGNGLYPLFGNLCFSGVGCLHGAFYGLRIGLLVWMSLIFCFSTTQEAITSAIIFFLQPLAHLKVPVDDIAMIISIALRFIPLIAAEFFLIRDAQWARGRAFDVGGLFVRVKSYGSLFIPLFVNLFRRADTLSHAMESRLYGLPGVKRTMLYEASMTASAWWTLLIGATCFIVMAVAL